MQRSDHLRRFRGGSIFILVMQSIAIAAGIVMLGVGDAAQAENARASMIGALLVIIPAIMIWNASILGGLFLVAIMGAEFALRILSDPFLPWPSIRSALYLTLSLWILREVIQYRRKSRRDGDDIGGSAIIRWGGAGVFALGGGAVALGLAHTYVSSSPATGLLTARQITGEQYRWMYDNDILGDAERVFLFSSDHGLTYSEGGNLLTNQYVSGWWREEDGDLDAGWIRIGEICSVEKTPTADDVEEVLYTIYTYGADSWLRILLPKKDGGDRQFLARMNYLNDQRMHKEVRSACDEKREPDWDLIAAGNGIKPDIIGPEDIDPDHLTWMRHNDFLTHKEQVLKFYSSGNYSIASGGLLLTNSYFGGWAEDTDGLKGWWFKLGDICTINKKKNATKTDGPLYKVESVDNWFQFHIPDKGGQDVAFIDQIKELNSAVRTDESEEACAAMLKEKAKEAKNEAIAAEAD